MPPISEGWRSRYDVSLTFVPAKVAPVYHRLRSVNVCVEHHLILWGVEGPHKHDLHNLLQWEMQRRSHLSLTAHNDNVRISTASRLGAVGMSEMWRAGRPQLRHWTEFFTKRRSASHVRQSSGVVSRGISVVQIHVSCCVWARFCTSAGGTISVSPWGRPAIYKIHKHLHVEDLLV